MIDREVELFIPPPVTDTKVVIAARRAPEVPCTVMRTPSSTGIFNKRFGFLEKVLSKAGQRNRIRSKVSESWNYI